MPDDLTPLGDLNAAIIKSMKDRSIERFEITDRANWLQWRQKDVTASTIAALIGEHEYQTRLGLYMLKSGQTEEDPEETEPMRRGRLLEPVALQLLQEDNPTWKIEPGRFYYRDAKTRLGGTPDAIAVDPSRPGFGIVQIKTVEPMVYRQKWQPDSEQEPEPPLWISVQALTEAYLTGASWAMVYPMRVSFGISGDLIEVPIHMGAMGRIKEEVLSFWRQVEEGRPPKADYAKDGALLRKMYELPGGTVVDLTGDNMALELAHEDALLREEIKIKTKRREAIKSEVIEKIGTAHVIEQGDADGPVIAMIDGQKFATSKTVHRKGYTVEPTSYRDVRITYKAPKE